MSCSEGPSSRVHWPLAIVCAVVFSGICGLPYVHWWAHPSLFDDDFLRVGSLRRSTLGEALFRPFNEHMAPLFETVSWLAWVGSGRQIMAIPLAFQVASFVGFGLTLGLLAAWVWQEVRSTTATLLSVALFCLSAVSAETVLWYSASSFQWAAASTLGALLAASMAGRSTTIQGRLGWSMGSAVAALMAPAFSAIGVLAGPLAAVRAASSVDLDRPGSLGQRLVRSIAPLVGTAGYFLLCERFQYRELVSASVRRSFDPLSALWATVRAPASVLIPGLFGLPEQSPFLPGVVLAGLSLIGLVLALAWSSRSRYRPLILVGLAMIFGGYFSTYATRARPGDLWIFKIQRYHLFPQIGLIGLIAAAASTRLRRFDQGQTRGFLVSTCLAGLLALVQYPLMREVSDRAFRYPDQPQALAATQRLEAVCERSGITMAQAMMALEPIQTPWYPKPFPFNPLLNLLPSGPSQPRIADALVRSTLLEALSTEDRESLFGGMNATRYALPEDAWPAGKEAPVKARALGDFHYEVNHQADDARALVVQGFQTSKPMEIWWAGEHEAWSPYRSVRWLAGGESRVVPLDLIPHWRRGQVRKLRLLIRDSGSANHGEIRFLK